MEKIKSIQVDFSHTGNGFDGSQIVDHWTVVLGNDTIEYSTGLGHRSFSKGQASHSNPEFYHSSGKILDEKIGLEAQSRALKNLNIKCDRKYDYMYPVRPKVEGILNCLFLDASCVSGVSFSDFCSELGYDEDSRNAFRTYESCIDNTSKLKRFFGRDYETVREYIESLEL
jgi:hypothetical protein